MPAALCPARAAQPACAVANVHTAPSPLLHTSLLPNRPPYAPPLPPITRTFQAARARAAFTSNENESWPKQRMHCKQLPLPCRWPA